MELRNISLLIIVLATVNAASLPSDVEGLKSLVASLASTLTQLEADFDHMQTQYDDRLAEMINDGRIPGVDWCNRTEWFSYMFHPMIVTLKNKQDDLEKLISDSQKEVQFQNREIKTLHEDITASRQDIANFQSVVAESAEHLREQKTTIAEIEATAGTMTEAISTAKCYQESSSDTGFPPTDCAEWFAKRNYTSGIYTIVVDLRPVQVWCEMSVGGWIVLYKRFDGSLNFTKTLDEYSDGFGDLAGEHWLGLNTAHHLTKIGNWQLLVELQSTDENNGTHDAWVKYVKFRIGASPYFHMDFDGYIRGTAGDSFRYNRNTNFTTYEMRDSPDTARYRDVARCLKNTGGWWGHVCEWMHSMSMLTGMPYEGNRYRTGIQWPSWTNRKGNITAVTLRIQRSP